jgi:gas vesicle protein
MLEVHVKFIFGLAIGVVLGLLYAPRPGEETREELYDKAREYAEKPQQSIADAMEARKDKVAEMGARLGSEAAKSAVDNVTEKLRDGTSR